MNTKNLNNLENKLSKVEIKLKYLEDLVNDQFYSKICDIIGLEIETLKFEESEEVLSNDISSLDSILDLLIFAKEDYELSPKSMQELRSQLEELTLTTDQEKALTKIEDLEEEYSYMDEDHTRNLPASSEGNVNSSIEEIDDDEFEVYVQNFNQTVEYISTKYNVPKDKVQKDLEDNLQYMELGEAKEELCREYDEEYGMKEDDDTQVDPSTDRAVPLNQLNTLPADTQQDILRGMHPGRLSRLPGTDRFYNSQVAEASLLQDLVKVADKLDLSGLHKEANIIDLIIKKIK